MQNQLTNLTDMLSKFVTSNTASTSGTLPSNTVTNPKEDLKGITTRSGVAYKGPTIPTTSSPKVVERETEVTKDTMPPTNNGSTEDVQPSVVPVVHHESISEPTGRALIDVYKGELTLHVGKEAVTFNLDQTSRYSSNYDDMTANRIEVIEMACEEYSQEILGFSDVIATYLNDDPFTPPNQGNYLPEIQKELKVCEAKTDKSSIDEPPEVELKDLPPHLEYAFLEGDDKLPIIIAKDLSVEEKAALIKILMEDDYKPAVQHQRRVNPKIHDVIKKEVEKLLDAGLIYPISDSPWVSPVHCVPKKGGFTVANDENELIPTQLVTGWRVCINYRGLEDDEERLCDELYKLETSFGVLVCPCDVAAKERRKEEMDIQEKDKNKSQNDKTEKETEKASKSNQVKVNPGKWIRKEHRKPTRKHEVVHKELGDNLVRAATTASSLGAEQDGGNINKTQFKATPNESSSQGTNSGCGPECPIKPWGITIARTRVLDLEKTKTTQQKEIASLKSWVESSNDEESLGEDASKQGRIDTIDADEEITLVSVHDEMEVDEEVVEVINTAKLIIDVAQVSVVGDKVTLEEMKSTKPKTKGVVIQELGESTTTKSSLLSSQQSHDKGKGIWIEPVKLMKKKDQISFDEETALKLKAKFDEEERLARKKAKKEQEANIALIETWDDIQAKIDADHQLARRL
ncbi:hypothetical protein Tco_0884552 [Tanacetum coccineum]